MIETIVKILYVDDNDSKVRKVNQYIKSEMPEILIEVVNDQISALKKIESEKFDLLLLDMQLPLRFGDDEPSESGGLNLLEEIFAGEKFKQPTRIIAFTEFEELQDNIREKYPELGAIKFDSTSEVWKITLDRTIRAIQKSKHDKKVVIYCEGANAKYYNMLNLPEIEFWALKDCRAIYFAAKNESDKYALRDRDFLTTNEINTLTSKPYYSNLIILNYYCFENYIYHPDNIEEAVGEFDKQSYLAEIIHQKNQKLDAIIQDYKLARVGYTEFTDTEKKIMDEYPEIEIISSLKSNDFETFYKFFDMAGKKDKSNKKSFDKKIIEKYNLTIELLVSTNWFKMKIGKLISDKISLN